jgi:hypothetical protein
MPLGFGSRFQSFESFGYFIHQSQHLRNERADLASDLDGILSEKPVFVVAVALTLRCPAALGATMHATPLPPLHSGSTTRLP